MKNLKEQFKKKWNDKKVSTKECLELRKEIEREEIKKEIK